MHIVGWVEGPGRVGVGEGGLNGRVFLAEAVEEGLGVMANERQIVRVGAIS